MNGPLLFYSPSKFSNSFKFRLYSMTCLNMAESSELWFVPDAKCLNVVILVIRGGGFFSNLTYLR